MAQRAPAVGTTPLPAVLVCERVKLADGDGALPMLQHSHVGGAALSQVQVAIVQVDVVEPQAAEGGVQGLVGLPGWRGLRASAHTIEAPTAPLRTAEQPVQNQQPQGQGKKGSRTKKVVWGRGTARTQTVVGVHGVRVVAEPVGGAASWGPVEP